MSLLGTQVYANPDTPLWLGTDGGTITGTLTVEGGVISENNPIGFTYKNGAGFGTQPGFIIEDNTGNQRVRLASVSGATYLQTNDQLLFSQIGTGNANSGLTLSAFGANADVLTIGGQVQAINGGFRVLASGAPPTSKMVIVNAANQSFIQSDDVLYFTPLTGVAKTSLAMAATPALDVFTTDRVAAKQLALEDVGPAPTVGKATLSGGTALIATTAADVTSYILLTHTNLNTSTAVGTLRVSNKGANDFTVVSVNAAGAQEAGDDSDFDWIIVNPTL